MNRSRRFIVNFVILSLLFAVVLGIIAAARPLADSLGIPWETARVLLILFAGIVMLAGSLTFLAEQRRPSEKRKHEDMIETDGVYTIGDDGELISVEENAKKQYR
jgi:membrane protein implicated in regulation of membrane protease activity